MNRALKACCITAVIFFQSGQISGQYSHSVIPVGNLADVPSVTSFSRALKTVLDDIGGKQTLLFSGDMIDARGDEALSFARIDTLLSILAPVQERRLIFIPGDRDWAFSGPDGWEKVMRLEEHLHSMDRPDIVWPLHHGCPGPEQVELDLGLHLIAVNTQWWNHPYEKPTPESATCDIATHEEAIEEVEKIIGEARFGNLLVVGHYPVISGGEYGGHYTFGRWVLPVPVISTMLTSFRQNIGKPVDIINSLFSVFREDMEDILREYPSLVYISGHDASREIAQLDESILIQSGIPSGRGYVSAASKAIYKSEDAGLVVLHYDLDGNVRASTYDLEGTEYAFDDFRTLLQAPCKTPLRNVPVNQRLVPCLDDKYVLPQMVDSYPSVTVAQAGPQYAARGFKKMMLGEHYRPAWMTPVQVPYLNLDTVAQGLIPYLKGGGRQTRSLRLRGEDGREYVFRSVDKDPSRALSYNLRETLISLAVRDQTTTQHPYGALVASRLLDETPVLHVQPRVYVMPDDEKLGPFRETFGNLLGMLEERPSGSKEVQKTFADADDILSSTEMFHELYDDRDNHIEAHEFIEARVFDILVGDWGKHEDNWKWAGYDQDTGALFRPIPRDRDHVFSRWDGFLPWLIDREWAKPSGENFDYRIRGLRSLMWQARHLDRLLANEMTREDWAKAANDLKSHVSPEDVDAAMNALPKEVRSLDGPVIASKLKARLTDIGTYAEAYYRMIATSVDVCGSNKNEHFDISRNGDGTVDVSMYKERDKGLSSPLYHRRFYPGETREVRLYGLQGDDTFTIHGNDSKSVLIRVVPGSGKNIVTDSSDVRGGRDYTRVYSLTDATRVDGGRETKEVRIPYPEAYRYRRTAFVYHSYLPLLYAYFSSGNGLSLGGGVQFTRQSYDKPNFSATHQLQARASSLGNFRFEYDGKLRHVLGRWDLQYGFFVDKHQRLNYFFGTGNNTEKDDDLLLDDFYTLRYSALQVSAGLSRSFWKRSMVEVILTAIGSGRENLQNNIFEPGTFPDVAGHDRLRVLKMHLACDLDFRDRVNLPQRGMRFMVTGTAGRALNDDGIEYAGVKGTLEHFTTTGPFTLGLKIGGAIHDGTTPFYDLFYLGQNTHLRGYRQNRFTGESLAFLNSDLRIQLINNPRTLIPYKLGLILFFDTGKIFDNPAAENDPGWHMGYGAGIYLVPLRERFAIHISAGFSEEESGLIRFGFGRSF